jgi:glycosyltransferase involved in cell wall biosynthesis
MNIPVEGVHSSMLEKVGPHGPLRKSGEFCWGSSMNTVRIAHILPWSTVGGTELGTLRLAEAAASLGFENLLYCPAGSENLRSMLHSHGLVTCCYRQVEPSYRRPWAYLKAARRLAQDLRRHHVRIVHCADILAAHYTALAGFLAGAYVVCHVRCEHSSISARDRTFLMPVKKFVFVSEDTWNKFGMKVEPSRGQILYDGFSGADAAAAECPATAREHYGLPADAFVIGMASRVHPCKDFETLIEAGRILISRFPNCRILIAGDYTNVPAHREHYAHLQALLRESAMQDHFVFSGFEANMERFFAAIDVFALSTHGEGFPLAIIEAMYHAKPVVATSVGGIPEAVSSDETGYLIPPRSPQQFAQALIELRQDPELYLKMSTATRRRMEDQFSAHHFHQSVKELYCSIARSSHLMGEEPSCLPT